MAIRRCVTRLPLPSNLRSVSGRDVQMLITLLLFQTTDFPSMSVTVPVNDVPSHSQYAAHEVNQLMPEHDPNLLYPPHRRSPLPRSPLASGGHSPSRSPSGIFEIMHVTCDSG